MKWIILYAVEREVEIEADNLNTACERAERERKEEEKIVVVHLERGRNMRGHGLR